MVAPPPPPDPPGRPFSGPVSLPPPPPADVIVENTELAPEVQPLGNEAAPPAPTVIG